MCSLICAWTNGCANHRDAGDFRRHRAHHDVTVMMAVISKYIRTWPVRASDGEHFWESEPRLNMKSVFQGIRIFIMKTMKIKSYIKKPMSSYWDGPEVYVQH